MIRAAAGILTVLLALPGVEASEPEDVSRVRGPAALAFDRDGGRLFVANGRSGSLSVIDPKAARVVGEVDLGRGLADVAAWPDGRHLAVVDRVADALLVVSVAEEAPPRVVGTYAVAADPVSVLVDNEGAGCVVASRGSRRLTFFRVQQGSDGTAPGLVTRAACSLPFRPGRMVFVDGGRRLVVADAFNGRLAVVDPDRAEVVAVRGFSGHNIRGLAVSPDGRSLAVAHQVLEPTAPTTLDEVHFGGLMRNSLRVLTLDAVLGAGDGSGLLAGARETDLDSFGNGAGDPGAVAFDRDGGLVVALSGVGEVALGESPTGRLRRVRAGLRPTAVVVSPDGATAFAADTAGDAVWAVDLPSGLHPRAIPLGPRPEPDAAERGERLFHDARMSHDHWLSCQSCHPDGRTNGLRADTLGDGTYGTPKLVPPLLGVGETAPWAWDGSVRRLEDQVRKSVEVTMQGTPPTEAQVADLTAYLRSLSPGPAGSGPLSEAAARGLAVFSARRCDGCHAPPSYTKAGAFDVGLVDEAGHRTFNPPSLRGVGARAPLLHDGRAATLDEVFRRFGHPRGASYRPGEVDDLLAFLRTL